LIALTAGFLAVAGAGTWPFAVLVAALAVVAAREIGAVHGGAPPRFVELFAALMPLAAAGGPDALRIAAGGTLIVVVAAASLVGPLSAAPARTGATLHAVMTPASLASFLVLLRGAEGGFGAVVFTYAAIQASDVFALLGGVTFGRRPLAPSVSPNKTWGGLVAGLLGAMAVGSLFAYAVPGRNRVELLAIAAALALLGVAGGLCASAWKRSAGLKDYGRLFPGHGGVVDRFDSLFFAAPLAWLLLGAAW
jgi:phosphatidate cytidylyltransferase